MWTDGRPQPPPQHRSSMGSAMFRFRRGWVWRHHVQTLCAGDGRALKDPRLCYCFLIVILTLLQITLTFFLFVVCEVSHPQMPGKRGSMGWEVNISNTPLQTVMCLVQPFLVHIEFRTLKLFIIYVGWKRRGKKQSNMLYCHYIIKHNKILLISRRVKPWWHILIITEPANSSIGSASFVNY